jgi:EAL domain-containing protein (putative c-di-GMP-specific phosphodiesterase class I)
VFFLAVGVALPAMMRRGTSTVQQDRRDERVEAEVRRALEHGEFVLHYQPIVALDDGRIIGAEALLRWQHPQHGLLSPAAFIDDLERLGSIANWVLGEATVAAAGWRAVAGHEEFLMSVNVSAKNIAQPDFVAQVRAALRAARLPPEHLCLEITESAAFEDLARASARLQVLRSIGVQIALDDFGTGHATLSYLQQLPFDVIKIDRSFVQDLGHRSCGSTIVATIQRLATDLDVTCVAEGVETEAQLGHLRELCCTAAQGYLFGRPQPAGQFAELLHRSPIAGRASDRSA